MGFDSLGEESLQALQFRGAWLAALTLGAQQDVLALKPNRFQDRLRKGVAETKSGEIRGALGFPMRQTAPVADGNLSEPWLEPVRLHAASIVARASRPLWCGHLARTPILLRPSRARGLSPLRERDAPVTAGGTPALRIGLCAASTKPHLPLVQCLPQLASAMVQANQGSPLKIQLFCRSTGATRLHFPRLLRWVSTYFPMLLTVSTQTPLAGSRMYLHSAASAMLSVT